MKLTEFDVERKIIFTRDGSDQASVFAVINAESPRLRGIDLAIDCPAFLTLHDHLRTDCE